jgi:hypothetical protein
MNKESDIHLLVKELIPMYDDLDYPAQNIVSRHIQSCNLCKEMMDDNNAIYETMKTNIEEDSQIRDTVIPFKKLNKFRFWLVTLLISIRILLLLFITTSFLINDYGTNEDIVFLNGLLWMMYLPIIIFLLIFTLVFVSKKSFWIHLLIDVLVLIGFSYIFSLFL